MLQSARAKSSNVCRIKIVTSRVGLQFILCIAISYIIISKRAGFQYVRIKLDYVMGVAIIAACQLQ